MTSDPQSALIVALVGIVVGVVGVSLAVYALMKLSRIYHAYELLQVAEGRETIVDVMGRTMDEFADLRDMGGRFSFSAALLDDAGDGLVITSIHARSETRTYLKGLSAGDSDITLSPEEMQAVRLARGADS